MSGYGSDQAYLRTVEALQRLHVPVVRWPGGCYADTYHWRTGIGRRDKRPVTVNYSWGGVEQRNQFFNFLNVIRDFRFDRWRYAQRLVDVAEVVNEVESDGVFVILDFR